MDNIDNKDPNDWDRKDDETDAPYFAFRCFLGQSAPRSLKHLSQQLGLAHKTCIEYSSRHKWFERARAWDRRVTAAEDTEALSEAGRLQREHMQQLRSTRDIGYTRIEMAGEDREKLPENINIKEAAKLFFEAVKAERLVVGEATERHEHAQKWDLSKLSVDEIQLLRELKRKATDDPE